MLKHTPLQNKSILRILSLMAVSLLILVAGLNNSTASAQVGGGSEPGANQGQTSNTTSAKLAVVSQSSGKTAALPSEQGAGQAQTASTDSGKSTTPSQSSPEGAYTPSEPGATLAQDNSVAVASFPSHWYSVAGSTFNPSSSTIGYSYGSSGCVIPSATGQWRASVNLPDGSIAEYIYINYYNTSSAVSSTGWLTRYKYDGTYSDLVSVVTRSYATTGTTGYYYDLSSSFSSTIDNLDYTYVFVWSGSTNQELCSLQVGYVPPSVFAEALPLVVNHY